MERSKYEHQLTDWMDREQLDEVIEQIEQYEGRGKGYRVGERNGKWAVFTEGSMVVRRQDSRRSYQGLSKDTINILQYRDFLHRM